MKFLNLDSPFMRFLSRMTDLLWLNILTIICCIPIITAGASFTAMHYVCLKLVRGEEGYISKDFFKSFKKNFKQATVIWLIILLVGCVLALDIYYLFTAGLINGGMWYAVAAGILLATVFIILTCIYVFPILSHFVNTVKGTIKNAFLMSIVALPKTFLMILLYISPFFFMYFAYQILPLVFLFWFSLPAYFAAMLYNKTFKKYEPEEVATNDYAWSVKLEDTDETDNNATEDNVSVEETAKDSLEENVNE